jgi:hypothetical protein
MTGNCTGCVILQLHDFNLTDTIPIDVITVTQAIAKAVAIKGIGSLLEPCSTTDCCTGSIADIGVCSIDVFGAIPKIFSTS